MTKTPEEIAAEAAAKKAADDKAAADAAAAAAAAAKPEDKSGERISELSNKLTVAEREKNEALERARKAEFDRDLTGLMGKYPDLKDVPKEQLEEAVKKGIPLEDAAVLQLHKAGKLAAPQNAPAPGATAPGFGGSAPNGNLAPPSQKKPHEMSAAESLEELKKAEARGEIFLS